MFRGWKERGGYQKYNPLEIFFDDFFNIQGEGITVCIVSSSFHEVSVLTYRWNKVLYIHDRTVGCVCMRCNYWYMYLLKHIFMIWMNINIVTFSLVAPPSKKQMIFSFIKAFSQFRPIISKPCEILYLESESIATVPSWWWLLCNAIYNHAIFFS